MAAQVKRFREHSARWQRRALSEGIDPRKWDRWRRLSKKSRAATSPRDYGAGKTVREQIRSELLAAASSKVVAVHNVQRGARRQDGGAVRLAAVRRNLEHEKAKVSNAYLRHIIAASPPQLAREIDGSLARSYGSGDRSPFWYEKRG